MFGIDNGGEVLHDVVCLEEITVIVMIKLTDLTSFHILGNGVLCLVLL